MNNKDRIEVNEKVNNVDWEADEWFAKHCNDRLTEDFKYWWISWYGTPGDFKMQNCEELHEYWLRCGFALQGWLAAQYCIKV